MEIKEISKQVYKNACEKGFWEGEYNIAEKLMLIVSELSEAMEADRKNLHTPLFVYGYDDKVQDTCLVGEFQETSPKPIFEEIIKNTFEDELADAAIRIFDLAEKLEIDLEWHIQQKHNYNTKRPYKHGKKY